MTTIPFNDVKRRVTSQKRMISAAIQRVMSSGQFILGKEVDSFEKEFANYCGTNNAIGVASGSDALEIALRALGLGRNCRVGLVANAGMYGTLSVLGIGGNPIFVDVEPNTANMSPDCLEEKLEEGLDAIIVTHLYGRMANMAKIRSLTDKARIPVIEDCAQAHGAEIDGQKAGTWGNLGCFSFYPTKNLSCLGDAGAIITNDETLAEKCRLLRQHGWQKKYSVVAEGGRNSRLDEIQAAVLRTQIPLLDSKNADRRRIAKFYDEAFQATYLRSKLKDRGHSDDVCHIYVVVSPRRNFLKQKLKVLGIGSEIHYPIPDCCQPTLERKQLNCVALTATHQLCSEVLSLPCFPELSGSEQNKIVQSVLSLI